MTSARTAVVVTGRLAILMATIAVCACSQTTVVLPSRDLDRPTDMAFTCMGLISDGNGGLQLAGQPMEYCHPPREQDPMPPPPLDPRTAGTQYRTYAFVANTDRGDLSVVDMSYCRSGDTRCWPPGAGLVDLDPALVGYAAAPLGVLPEVVAASQDGCRLVSANRGSCDLTFVNPEVLLTPHAVSALNAINTTKVGPAASTPDINTYATTVVPMTDSGRLSLAPGEIAFLPQQTGNLLSGAPPPPPTPPPPMPQPYCDANGTFAPPVGVTPTTDGASVPWRAIVTFPSCDLIAMIDLPSGNVVDSYQVGTAPDGKSFLFSHSGRNPVCPRADCGSSVGMNGAPSDAGSDGATDGASAEASGDDGAAVDASDDDASTAGGDGGDAGPGTPSDDAGVTVTPTGQLNVSSLAIHPDGTRVYFGATNAGVVGALDIAGDSLMPAGSTELHNGAAGATRIRLSIDPYAYSKGHDAKDVTRPEYGRFVAGRHDGQDPPLEFLYVLARDGSLRVLDVAEAGGKAPYECDLTIDATDPAANALGDEPAVRTPCFEYSPDPKRVPAELLFASGPGLRLGGTLQDVAFASYLTPRLIDLNVDETSLSGAFAFAMTTTGAVYVINIDPELRNIKEIRGGVAGRFPESPRPLTHSVRDVNVVSYSSALGPQNGAPRIDSSPTGPTTGPSLESFMTSETFINALAAPTVSTVNGMEALSAPPTAALTYVYFPNRATVNPQQWSITWEGDLTGVRLTGDLLATPNKFTDNGAGFCDLGALAGDVLSLTGCADNTGCGPGTVCVHGTGVPTSVDGRAIPGLCLDQNNVTNLSKDDECGRLLKTFRRYEIVQSNHTTLTVRPKKDEVPRPVFKNAAGERTTCDPPPALGNNDCKPVGDTVHGAFACVGLNVPTCDPTTQVDPPCEPVRRCLQACTTDTECRQGRACVPFDEGHFCAEAIPLDSPSSVPSPTGDGVLTVGALCFQQLVSYKLSAGNTFVVSGSAVGRPEVITEAPGSMTCDQAPPTPILVARIPMNAPACDASVLIGVDSKNPQDTTLIRDTTALKDTAVAATRPTPNPCFLISETPIKGTDVPPISAFYENAEIRFVLKDIDHQITDGYQIRFEVHGGVGAQFVNPSADSSPGLPARILLGPVPQPEQTVALPLLPDGNPSSDLPYIFVVDQRQFSGGRLGARGQILRITPRIADTVPVPGFETFAASGSYFPIQ